MTINSGPNLGLMVDGLVGEQHYVEFMKFMRAMDGLVQCSVLDKDLTAPPASPTDGAMYIVADLPTGAWVGHAGRIARYYSAQSSGPGWEFYTPKKGWRTHVKDEGVDYQFNGSFWVVDAGGGGGGGVAPVLSFRNKIINGAFQVKQAAPTVDSGTVTLTSGQYGWLSTVKGFDRWKAGSSGCTYTFSTTGGVSSIDITAGSLIQVIEGKNLTSGGHVLSWSGTAQGKIGVGSYAASGVAAAVTGGVDLAVEFGIGTLSNVQFEPGTTATIFERRHFPFELQLCKRYFPMFLAIGTGTQFLSSAFVFSSPQISVAYQFDVEPRVPPTGVIVSSPAHFNVNAGGGGAGPATAVTFNSASSKAARLLATAPGAITTGGGAEFFASGTDGAYLYFTGCEL